MRCAILFITLLASTFSSQAAAETLALEVDTVEARINAVMQEPILTFSLKPGSKAAVAEFTRLRVGEPVTMRLGNERLITSVVREPIMQGMMTVGGGDLTYEVVRQMARDIRAGERLLFLDGSDK